MKKNVIYKIVLLLIALFLININVANAKDQLVKVRENDKFYYYGNSGNINQKVLLYKDGYVLLLTYDSIDYDLTPYYILSYVKMDGTVISVLEGEGIISFAIEGEYIYVISNLNSCEVDNGDEYYDDDDSDDLTDDDDDYYEEENEYEENCEFKNTKKIIKYDSEFNEVASIKYSHDEMDSSTKVVKFEVTYDTATSEYIFLYKNNEDSKDVIIVDKDFKNYKENQYNDEMLKKYFYKEYLIETYQSNNEYKKINSFDSKEELVVASGKINTKGKNSALLLYKTEDIEALEIVNDDYVEFTDIKIVGNGIVVIGIKDDFYAENMPKSDILIYDAEGNLAQTISNNGKYFNFDTNGEIFIASAFDSTAKAKDSIYGEGFADNEAKSHNEIYDVEGLVLKGMSSSIRNPQTADIALYSMIAIAVISAIFLSKSYKEKKWLK